MEKTMKVIDVEKAFKHSDDGNIVNDYLPGEQVVSDRCAEVAVKQLKVAKASKKDPEKFVAEQAENESADSEE